MDEEDAVSGLRKMVEEIKFRNEAHKKMDEVTLVEKEKAEKAIMMDLWGWLSNNTETYSDAFHAIEDYNRALRELRNQIVGRPHHILIKMTECLAAQLALDVELWNKLQATIEEMEKKKTAQ